MPTLLSDPARLLDSGATLSRRRLLRLFGGASVAIASAGIAVSGGHASAQSATQYQTTAPLNFRAGPGTNHPVIAVIPQGGTVTATGNSANSFLEVGYGGTYGWAHGDYLTPAGGGGGTGDPVIVDDAKTTDDVNLRSGPSTGHQVLRVVPIGTWVQVSDTSENGFRYVVHDGLAGWIYEKYLAWWTEGQGDDQGGNYATTTTALNLRAEPSTSSAVLTVMPAGARVQVLHTQASGFVNVNYAGMQGWAYMDYLAW